MKRTVITVVFLTAQIFASQGFAQGRHDEKPHGVMKSSPATGQTQSPATGGRHDEGGGTHGKKKPPMKKAQKAEQKKAQTPAADAAR